MRLFYPTIALAASLVTGIFSSPLFAQDQQQQPAPTTSQALPSPNQPRHAANPQREAKKMTKKLGLTADQESKLEPILADRQQQVESTRTDTTLAPKDKRAKLRSIRQDSDAKFDAILNDTQKQQYEQIKQSHKAAKQQQGGASTKS